jgi:hypothetical protein
MMDFFNQLVQMEQKAKNIRGYATAQTNLDTLVQDRKTGLYYNPQEAFDRLMNKPETLAMLKRLAVR